MNGAKKNIYMSKTEHLRTSMKCPTFLDNINMKTVKKF